MKRLAAIVCGTTLAVAALSGCGSDSGASGGSDSAGDYCGTIEDVKNEFSSIEDADTSIDDMSAAGERFNDIVDAAPSDIKSDWETLAAAFEDMTSALEDAGLDTDKPMQEAMEADPKAAQEAQAEVMKALGGVQDSQKAIQTEVKDECGIDMGAGAAE
ncbi:MAG: hypothetical protein ACRDO7_17195 [Nocardioidaceae bacterium]